MDKVEAFALNLLQSYETGQTAKWTRKVAVQCPNEADNVRLFGFAGSKCAKSSQK